MAISFDKESGDIIFGNFTEGVGQSPHKGLGNMQNVNLGTAQGEAAISFGRTQSSMTQTSATGTLSFADSSHVSLSIPGSNNLFKGNWITVTGSSHTGEVPNGTYYVPPSTGANFQLQNYYAVSATARTGVTAEILLVAGGGGGAGTNGTHAGNGGSGGTVTHTASSAISSNTGYTVIVGTGGAGGAGGGPFTGVGGTPSSLVGGTISLTAAGGAGGAVSTAGSQSSGDGGTGGTGTAGTSGGTSNPNNGGNGGAGAAYSISGSSVTYGDAGGGGSYSGNNGPATGGTGGSGNGGAGGNNTAAAGNPATNGSNAVAQTGSGGGGAAAQSPGGGINGGNGSGGIVMISVTQGIINVGSTTGGTHTVSGGKDIWTFTANGVWVPIFNGIAAPTNLLTGFTAGLTATIQLKQTLGKPIAKFTETYFVSGVSYNRYYILDNQNLVWIYDTYNETLYSTSDNVGWFLPDYQTGFATNVTGIGVISGMLIVAAQSGVYGKPVATLGATNTQSTNWTELYDDVIWQSPSTSSHTIYVGHQGNMYITDGNYIRSIFPTSTLATNNGAYSITGDNVQTLASWTSANDSLGQPTVLVHSVVSGALPYTSDNLALPAIFFTNGALPQSLVANQIYYIKKGIDGYKYSVYVDPSMSANNNAFFTTGTIVTGATTATLSSNWTKLSGYYLTTFTFTGSNQTINVYYTNGSTSISWATPLTGTTTAANINVWGALDISTGAVGTQYYATFYPFISASDWAGSNALYVLTPQQLTLPQGEIAKTMAEIGNILLIGCVGSALYPYDQTTNLPSNIIFLPESNVQAMITVNQMAYVFAGNKGNIYISDGAVASLVTKVPDYCAGIPGSPSTYIEPYFAWGDAMYLRGRVYFSILDQTAVKVGNCGGIWSFIPTQNFYIGQDIGLSLRLENENSYQTYNGAASVLIPRVNQVPISPQYFSGWYSDITTPTYGIDSTGTYPLGTGIIETEIIPVGTILGQQKKTFTSEEYKVSSPLLAGESIQLFYRQNLTDAWTSCGAVDGDSSNLSGYFPVNFQNNQWVQFRAEMTPNATNTFSGNRLTEIRLHPSKYERG